MVEIIKSGDWKSQAKLFNCGKCGCVFRTNDFRKPLLEASFIKYRCPECGAIIKRSANFWGWDKNDD